MRKWLGFLTSPVFVVGVVYWAFYIWWDCARDWVLEINQFEKEKLGADKTGDES